MDLATAEHLATHLLEEIRPFCIQAEVAGSIRRRKIDVRDIEIVACPIWQEQPNPENLFAEPEKINLLYDKWAHPDVNCHPHHVQWIKPGVSEVIPWGVKPEGKYWRGLITLNDGAGHIKLDLFLCDPRNFGIILLIRTGSAEFSEAVVTHARRIGKKCANGRLQTEDGEIINTPTEEDAFAALNLATIPPRLRISAQSLRARSYREQRMDEEGITEQDIAETSNFIPGGGGGW